MIAYARGKMPAAERVEWQQADAMSLPFGDEMFDVVVCQFGVMFVPEKVAQALIPLCGDKPCRGKMGALVWEAARG